jgi:hypothetical protein
MPLLIMKGDSKQEITIYTSRKEKILIHEDPQTKEVSILVDDKQGRTAVMIKRR